MNHTIASGYILFDICIYFLCTTIHAIPRITFAITQFYIFSWAIVCSWQYSQVQGCNTIATIGVNRIESIVTTLSVSSTIPIIRLACYNCCLRSGWMIDSQMQGCNAITTILTGCGVSIVTTLSVSSTIPLVRTTSYNCCLRSCWIVDCQVQGGNAIASIYTLGREGIITTLSVSGTIPLVRTTSYNRCL